MKKALSLILALLMTASATLCSCGDSKSTDGEANTGAGINANPSWSSSADCKVETYTPSYPELSFEEVIDDSVLIVDATFQYTKAPVMRDGIVYTDHVFCVRHVFSGDESMFLQLITVEFMGGTLDNTEYVVENYPTIPEESDDPNYMLLILKYPTDENGEITTTDRYTFYPPKGILQRGERTTSEGVDLLESYDHTVSFTWEDFMYYVDRVKK